MNDSEFKKIIVILYYLEIQKKKPRDRRFLNFGDSSIGGTHLTWSFKEDSKSFYFESFGGHPA